ncbi:TetR family transcriptional regulator [Mycobacterium malmoense]|uniref:TetR family transcriptional regulator n=2 Tax=Mycobacterium malmoense TaxID=1780 RepID=A0ABX3SY93_MYCMA|nr:TetR family transcriptional regulator [Mycobacterium malmoense]QZA19882.1 TetR family transcriptional regulator [Mycobacterium malmoense]UNB96632.1 TetR/AcrR family transcriptional regulator [Mycobacterium malmoense]
MTSSQLKRRAKIIDAVTDLIGEAGADAVQMRDVAQRAGVALATLYKYFSSKEDLLVAALAGWQTRVVQPIAGAAETTGQDLLSSIVDYLGAALRASYVDPEMTALALRLTISTEPTAMAAMHQMLQTNAGFLNRLVDVVAPEELPHVAFGLSAALTGSLIGLLTGRMTLEASLSHVEWLARVLLGDVQPRTRK